MIKIGSKGYLGVRNPRMPVTTRILRSVSGIHLGSSNFTSHWHPGRVGFHIPKDGFPEELIGTLGFVAKNEGLHIQNMYYKEGGYWTPLSSYTLHWINFWKGYMRKGYDEQTRFWPDSTTGFPGWWDDEILANKLSLPNHRFPHDEQILFFLVREPDSKIWPQKIWVRWIGM